MPTLQELYHLRYEEWERNLLKQRVTAQIAVLAMYIKGTGGVGPDNHANQLIWAERVLSSGEATLAEADKMMWAVLESTAIQQNGNQCQDSDIAWIVENKLNLFATGT